MGPERRRKLVARRAENPNPGAWLAHNSLAVLLALYAAICWWVLFGWPGLREEEEDDLPPPLCFFSWDPSWLCNSVDPDGWMEDTGCAGAVSLSTVPPLGGEGFNQCTAVAWSLRVPVKEPRGHTRGGGRALNVLICAVLEGYGRAGPAVALEARRSLPRLILGRLLTRAGAGVLGFRGPVLQRPRFVEREVRGALDEALLDLEMETFRNGDFQGVQSGVHVAAMAVMYGAAEGPGSGRAADGAGAGAAGEGGSAAGACSSAGASAGLPYRDEDGHGAVMGVAKAGRCEAVLGCTAPPFGRLAVPGDREPVQESTFLPLGGATVAGMGRLSCIVLESLGARAWLPHSQCVRLANTGDRRFSPAESITHSLPSRRGHVSEHGVSALVVLLPLELGN